MMDLQLALESASHLFFARKGEKEEFGVGFWVEQGNQPISKPMSAI